MLVEERGNIVDEAGNEDEWALLRLLLDCNTVSALKTAWLRCGDRRTRLPRDDGEVARFLWPLDRVLLSTKTLERLREHALLDLVLGEDLEVARKTKPGADPDEPLRRVVLVPLDRVAVVHGELVVEIVVALADGDERGDEVVARRVRVAQESVC